MPDTKRKRSKLFHAFTGDAIGLRDVLIEHFYAMARQIPFNEKGTTYADGFNAGEIAGYREAALFLKRLVVNDDELRMDGRAEDVPSQQQKQDE